MKIAVSSTNPCHLFDMAVALSDVGAHVDYYSGYPEWKLGKHRGAGGKRFRVISRSLRTLVTYGMLRLPHHMRPRDGTLFEWQDTRFDRIVARELSTSDADIVYAMPGQCRDLFRLCRTRRIPAVLNHASGPVNAQKRLVAAEYERAGVSERQIHRFNAGFEERERAEFALADYHCAASSIVKAQLVEEGVNPDRVLVVPYGADPGVFPKRHAAPADRFRILFAGQLCLRKGTKTLLDTLETAGEPDWECHFYGSRSRETAADFSCYRGATTVERHGAVSRPALAEAMRGASVLVLPSWEEAFGLVVVQALQSGVPCIVSDRVGAGDLIRHRSNGSIFPVGNVEALLEELRFWERRPTIIGDDHGWEQPARMLHTLSETILL